MKGVILLQNNARPEFEPRLIEPGPLAVGVKELIGCLGLLTFFGSSLLLGAHAEQRNLPCRF
jgi:hypothetical protein